MKSLNFLKKMFVGMAVVITVFSFSSLSLAQGTILPKASSDGDCDDLINSFITAEASGQKVSGNVTNDILGCAIVTGRISLSMVPYFIKYFSNYLLGIISLVSLLFIVLGGFFYTMSGLTPDKKDRGKTYIKNAITGMVIAFLAWTVVNVIISAITG